MQIKISILNIPKSTASTSEGVEKKRQRRREKVAAQAGTDVKKKCLHTSKLSSLRPGGGSVSARLAAAALVAVVANCSATAVHKLAYKPKMPYW